jgi:hypothetical protein
MKKHLLIITLSLFFFGSAEAQQIIKIEAEKTALVKEEKIENQIPKQTGNYTRPTAGERFKRSANRIFGPVSLGTKVLSAGISTATNSPEEWGGNWKGFGKRFASSMGKSIIKESATYTLDEAFKLDSTFYRSQKRDTKSKLSNAVLSTFTARKADGKRVVGVPRLVGTYSSSIIAAETWYPKRFDYKDGLRSGTISLGVNVAVNLFREFFRK